MRNRKTIGVVRNAISLFAACNQLLVLVSLKRLSLYFTQSFIVFLFFSLSASAQIKQLVKIDTVAKAIYTDNLDNVYLQLPSDELLKYTNDGKLKWRYSNNRFGKLHSVDVSDPLRIILFYADFQQVVVLNNNLSEITKYAFSKDGDLWVSAVASGNNNSVWVFDRISNALIKLSNNFTEQTRSASFYQIFDAVIKPKKLVAVNEFVFLQQEDNSLLQFDRFGGFIRQLSLDSLTDFTTVGEAIFYEKKGYLIKYHSLTFETSKLKLPLTSAVKQVALGNKIIAVLTEKAVFLLSNN